MPAPQLQQRDGHVLAGLLAIAVDLEGHAVRLHRVVWLSQVPASNAQIVPGLNIPCVELHCLGVPILGLRWAASLGVLHPQLEVSGGVPLRGLHGVVEQLRIWTAGHLQLHALLGEAARKPQRQFRIARLRAQRLAEACGGICPALLLRVHGRLAPDGRWVPRLQAQGLLETRHGLLWPVEVGQALATPVVELGPLRLQAQSLVDQRQGLCVPAA
mmetsp:Transcript_108723/g.325231  ORF Transcript_108723/g.325231 Transcript_108723/m.325231 type:complete len:215 (-) Transcript_108723:137-781(-)